MFDLYADEFRGDNPIASWRRTLATRESDIVHLLDDRDRALADRRDRLVPAFTAGGPEVEVVLKSSDAKALREAVAWLEPELMVASSPRSVASATNSRASVNPLSLRPSVGDARLAPC